MGKSLWSSVVAALALSFAASASDQQLASAEEAKAMLDRVVGALKADAAKALSAFNDPSDKQFHDRDLFVSCFTIADGKITAYSSPALLGVDIRTLALKDDPIGQRAYDAVHNVPEGEFASIDYNLPKPGTTVPVPKRSLQVRVGDQACAVAYFK